MMAHVCCHQQNLIAMHRKSLTEVIQTNTNLSGAKGVSNKAINGLYRKKISKRSVEMTLCYFPQRLCLCLEQSCV